MHYNSSNAGQITEIINRNALVSRLLTQGYNVFIPVYDGGIDFIIHRERDDLHFKVQLKSRWTIDKKYLGRDIWVAFPDRGSWYLMPHDAMVEMARDLGFTETVSWREKGCYHRSLLSRQMLDRCARYRLTKEVPLISETVGE